MRKNLTISLSLDQRIAISFILVVILTTMALLFASYSIKQTADRYDDLVPLEIDIDTLMLQLRRDEKDFLMRNDSKYMDQFNTNYEKIKLSNKRAIAYGNEFNLLEIVKDGNTITDLLE